MQAQAVILNKISTLQTNGLPTAADVLKQLLTIYIKQMGEKQATHFFRRKNCTFKDECNKAAALKLARACVQLLEYSSLPDPVLSVIWRLNENADLINQGSLLNSYLSAFFSHYFIYNTKLSLELLSELTIINPYSDAIRYWEKYLLSKASLENLSKVDCDMLNWLYPFIGPEHQTQLKKGLFSNLANEEFDPEVAHKISYLTNINDTILQNYIKSFVEKIKNLLKQSTPLNLKIEMELYHVFDCLKKIKTNLTIEDNKKIINDLLNLAIPTHILFSPLFNNYILELLRYTLEKLPDDVNEKAMYCEKALSYLDNNKTHTPLIYYDFLNQLKDKQIGFSNINRPAIAEIVAKSLFIENRDIGYFVKMDCQALLKIHKFLSNTLRATVIQSIIDNLYPENLHTSAWLATWISDKCSDAYYFETLVQLEFWLTKEQRASLLNKILNNIIDYPGNHLLLSSSLLTKLEKEISQQQRETIIATAIKNLTASEIVLQRNASNILTTLSHWIEGKQLPAIIALMNQERLNSTLALTSSILLTEKNFFTKQSLITMLSAMAKLTPFLTTPQKKEVLAQCLSLLENPYKTSVTNKIMLAFKDIRTSSDFDKLKKISVNNIYLALKDLHVGLNFNQRLQVIDMLLKNIKNSDSPEFYSTLKKYFFALDEGRQISLLNQILPRETGHNEKALNIFIKLQHDWQTASRDAAIPRLLAKVKAESGLTLPTDMIKEIMAFKP